MHIVHNILNQEKTEAPAKEVKPVELSLSGFRERAEYKAYKRTLKKYADRIQEIQKVLPDWKPAFVSKYNSPSK